MSSIAFVEIPEFHDSVQLGTHAQSFIAKDINLDLDDEMKFSEHSPLRREKSEEELASLQATHTKKALLCPPIISKSEIDAK